MTDSPPYPAVAVANFFIERAQEEGRRVTPLKLQKLVYFAHGWHLALHDAPLLEERVEAWEYGPVVQNLYRRAKKYGRDPIPEPLDGDFFTSDTDAVDIPASDAQTRSLLRRVWNSYKGFSAVDLSAMTHKKGWAWHRKWHEDDGKNRRNAAIPDEYIKDDFQELKNE